MGKSRARDQHRWEREWCRVAALRWEREWCPMSHARILQGDTIARNTRGKLCPLLFMQWRFKSQVHMAVHRVTKNKIYEESEKIIKGQIVAKQGLNVSVPFHAETPLTLVDN